MNPSEKKQGQTPSAAPHHFPSLEKDIADAAQNTSDAQFKPLFSSGSGAYSPSLPSEKKNEIQIDPEQKEKVRKAGYDKGFEAGRQQACRLAKEAVEPNLVDFLQAYENVSAFHQHVTDTAASQIIQMALKICERILSTPLDTAGIDIDAIQRELKDVMTKAHRINLCFHPEDVAALEELMSCFSLPWPKSEAVDIETTEAIQKGQLTVEHNEQAQKDMSLLMTDRLPSLLTYSQQQG